MQFKADRIVLFRIGSMGDTVVALPCFHAVRRAFPSSIITLLANIPISSKAAPMMMVLGQESGFYNNALNYTIGLRNPIEAFNLLRNLRALKAQTLVYMRSKPTPYMLRRDRLFFRLAGFRHILCAPQTADQRVSRFDSKSQQFEPEASRLARCFEPLGPIDLADPASWDLRLTDAEQATGARLAASLPSPFLAINTGGKAAAKDWGFERWAAFLNCFRQQTRVRGLAILGAGDDWQRADSFVHAWGDGALNLCGGPTPREVAALLGHAHLFIGHDSGPLHLAQSMGTPTLGLFGAYNKPKEWHPIGAHVQIIHELRGMEAISVDQVLQRALAMWGYS